MTRLLLHRSKNLRYVHVKLNVNLVKIICICDEELNSVKYFILVIPRCSISEIYEREDTIYNQFQLYFFFQQRVAFKNSLLHTNIANSRIRVATVTYARHKSARIKWTRSAVSFFENRVGRKRFSLTME